MAKKKSVADELTPSQEKELQTLESEGFSPEPGFEKYISTELGTPAASADVQKIYDALAPLVRSLAHKPAAATPSKGGAKKAGNNASMTQEQALQALSDYLLTNQTAQAENVIAGEGQQLANQNQAVTNTVAGFLGGGGVSSGNPAVDAAQQAYAQAYGGAEGINSAAYTNMAKANEQYEQYAGLYPIANLLTQGYGSTQYKELPANVVSTLPPSIRNTLAQYGITQATPTGGSSGISLAPGTGGTGANSANISAFIAGLTGGANSANSAGGGPPPTGNPNIPTT